MEAGYDSRAGIRLTITALLLAAFLGGINLLNVRATNKFQEQLDALRE